MYSYYIINAKLLISHTRAVKFYFLLEVIFFVEQFKMNVHVLWRPLMNAVFIQKPILLPTFNKTCFNSLKLNPQHVFADHFYTSGVNFSKGKDRGKEKKSKKGEKVNINIGQLASVIDVNAYKSDLQKHLDRLKDDFVKHVTLRSSSGSIESLKVSFEGKQHELQELAQVVRKNPKTIVLNMAAFPQAIPAVVSAINSSGLNLNPQQDGTSLFLPIPKVTKEYRETLAKNAKVLFIKCKDLMRDNENNYLKKLRNQEESLSEDELFNVKKQIMAVGAEYTTEARNLYESKHKELTKE